MAYTYLIGWSKLGKYYYGVRYAQRSKPEDLWIKYKTSSKYVKEFYKANGEPDIVQVRRVFSDKESALQWEEKVLRRLRVADREDFLNRWDNNMVPYTVNRKFCGPKAQAKAHKTLKERYGGRGSSSPLIKEKVFRTNERRYGTYHTLAVEKVKSAREKAAIKKYGVDNPWKNPEKFKETLLERHGVTNMMHHPDVATKHKEVMANKDWSERNEKSRQTTLKRFGVSCNMNAPEVIARNSRPCPMGCKNGKIFNAGGFAAHMKCSHGWSKEEVRRFKDENPKNPN